MNTHARPRKVTHRPPNAASIRGLQMALAALHDDSPAPADPLALREQWRREDEARRHRQGELKLSSG